MYRQFSDRELEQLREYVKTPEFVEIIQTGNARDQMVATMRFLHEDPDKIAFALLGQSWHLNRSRYSKYAKEALAAYNEILKNPPQDEKLWKLLARGEELGLRMEATDSGIVW